MGSEGVPSTVAEVMSVAAVELTDASSWWHDIDDSPLWQDRMSYTLAVLYGSTGSDTFESAGVRLDHAEVRCVVFIFYRNVQRLKPEIVQHILLDVPSLAFFTTYALLVLFWAEIYYQASLICGAFASTWLARAVSTDGLKPSFYTINIVVYVVQITLWLILWWKPISGLLILSKMFFAGLSMLEIWAMWDANMKGVHNEGSTSSSIYKSPRRCDAMMDVACTWELAKNMGALDGRDENGVLTRMMCFNAFDKNANLDVLDHPILNFIYYLVVEILPSSLVLFILRKLPPKRGITQYHPIR
ncbi:hypothetical protein JHK84_054754 [Glycine max]|nr:hypothetical protein JHK85_055683 [Glycine max]KAG5073523.1 hypothetical protein JHK84_054754 [Glycine max]